MTTYMQVQIKYDSSVGNLTIVLADDIPLRFYNNQRVSF